MIRFIKQWFKAHFDYRIIGEYYDTTDGVHYIKKYDKKYYFKKRGKNYE